MSRGSPLDAAERLVMALLTTEASGDAEAGRVALERLAARPLDIVRLDGLARREFWRSGYAAAIDTVAHRVAAGAAGPLGVALACTHWNGRVRERAVRSMVDRPNPLLTPFLVLRTADWVRQVRDPARAGLALLLHDDPRAHLAGAVSMAGRMRDWLRGEFAAVQVRAAALHTPRETWARLGAGEGLAGRRIVFDAVLFTGRLGIDELAEIAEADPDPAVRARAAETVVRDALWTTRLRHLRLLSRSRHREVRALAVTGLVRAGQPAEAVAFLDDPGTLVRAVARDAARRTGVDPLAHYRSALTTDPPPLGAIDGLAEVGGAADGDLPLALLGHPVARVRAHAVRALRQLGGPPTEALLPLLRDPSTAVLRETAAALRPAARTLPTDLLWGLLADDHPARRRAAYRLLRSHDRVTQARAALLLAVDEHPPLAQRGVADITRIARDPHRHLWRARPVARLNPEPRQAADLRRLIEAAAPAIGPITTRLLLDQLAHRA